MSDHRPSCQPIQDQGNCGSCTAFGITGIAELRAFLKYGTPIKLSEKDLFFCSGGKCAQGNTMDAAFARAMRGIPVYECCPYEDKDALCGQDRCEEWWSNAIKVLDPELIIDDTEIDIEIDGGGIVGTMAVYESFTYLVGDDVYTGPTGIFDPLLGYHCIGIVGRTGDGADILRNSWATDWGNEGYCKITRKCSGLEYWRLDISNEVEPDDGPEPDDGLPVNPLILAIIVIVIIIAIFLQYLAA